MQNGRFSHKGQKLVVSKSFDWDPGKGGGGHGGGSVPFYLSNAGFGSAHCPALPSPPSAPTPERWCGRLPQHLGVGDVRLYEHRRRGEAEPQRVALRLILLRGGLCGGAQLLHAARGSPVHGADLRTRGASAMPPHTLCARVVSSLLSVHAWSLADRVFDWQLGDSDCYHNPRHANSTRTVIAIADKFKEEEMPGQTDWSHSAQPLTPSQTLRGLSCGQGRGSSSTMATAAATARDLSSSPTAPRHFPTTSKTWTLSSRSSTPAASSPGCGQARAYPTSSARSPAPARASPRP